VGWWRACAIGALVVSAACSSSDDDGARSTSVPSTGVPSTGVPSTGATSAAPAALAFAAPTVGGDSLDLSGYAGKAVAFWFWAPY
jgi:hypothetical protein